MSQTSQELDEEFRLAPILLSVAHENHTINFFPLRRDQKPNSEWLNPQQRLEEILEEMHTASGGMPKEIIEDFMRKNENYALLFYAIDHELCFIKLAIDLPPNIACSFYAKGSINIHIETNEGKNIIVPDKGIIIPRNASITKWYDSRPSNKVVLTTQSIKNRKSGKPPFILLIVPKTLKGTIEGVTLNKGASISTIRITAEK